MSFKINNQFFGKKQNGKWEKKKSEPWLPLVNCDVNRLFGGRQVNDVQES